MTRKERIHKYLEDEFILSVLNEGKVEAEGTHKELLKTSEAYKKDKEKKN